MTNMTNMTKWPGDVVINRTPKTTKFRDRGRKRSPGFKGLAREVVLLAVKDATGHQKDERVRRSAYRFFQDSRMLGIYCELAEWDVDYISENVDRLNEELDGAAR